MEVDHPREGPPARRPVGPDGDVGPAVVTRDGPIGDGTNRRSVDIGPELRDELAGALGAVLIEREDVEGFDAVEDGPGLGMQ